MNPGIAEETGETARSAVSALSTTPALLALILLQLFTIGAVAYSIYNRQQANLSIINKLIDQCGSKQAAQSVEPGSNSSD